MRRSTVTVLVTAIIIGQTVSAVPDYQQAKRAADRVFHLLGSVPNIDSYSDAGVKPVRENHSKKKGHKTQNSRLGQW